MGGVFFDSFDDFDDFGADLYLTGELSGDLAGYQRSGGAVDADFSAVLAEGLAIPVDDAMRIDLHRYPPPGHGYPRGPGR